MNYILHEYKKGKQSFSYGGTGSAGSMKGTVVLDQLV